MKNFATLYRYELRKLLARKLVWVLLAAFSGLVLLMTMGDVLSTNRLDDGTKQSVYDYEAHLRAASRRVSGTALDDATLKTVASRIFTGWLLLNHPTQEQTDEIEILSRYMHELAYPGQSWPRNIGLAQDTQPDQDFPASAYALYESWQALPESQRLGANFYADRRATAGTAWQTYYLTDAQQAYWRAQEDTLPTPFIWQYAQGWQMALQNIQILNIMVLVLAAAGLAGSFGEEATRRTDQLLLTGRYGRGPLYTAKWLAGASVVLGGGVWLVGLCLGVGFALYGTEGAQGVIQLSLPFISRHLTFGTALATFLALLTVAALLYSALTLFLSELWPSGAAVLAAAAGPLLFCNFANIDPAPGIQGVLSHILYLLPTRIVRSSALNDPRLVPCPLAPGGWLTNLQAGLVLYPLLAALLTFLGWRLWRRRQIRGR